LIKRLVLLACFVAVTPLSARASTITFQGLGNAEWVSLTVKTGSTTTSLSGWAGELDWYWSAGQPAGWSHDLYTYCVDLLHDAQYTQTVSVYGTDDLQTAASHGAQKAAWLFNTSAGYVHDTLNADYLGAGLQLAIWEVLYDNNYSLTGSGAGNFKVTSASLDALKAANYYLSALSNIGDAYLSADAAWLDVKSPYLGQDQMTYGPTPVPEPATLVLFGSGLAVVAARARKRRTQD
jgi:hypothetical protein